MCKTIKFCKNCRIIYIIIMIICSIVVSLNIEYKVMATPSETEKDNLILIDAGHGGRDSGAVSKNGYLEKDINLKIALKVRDKLNALGFEATMTRETDEDFYGSGTSINLMKRQDLNYRCKIKRDTNCDLFISIHQNFFKQSSCKGSQVWYSRNEESKKIAHILQENFKKDLGSNKRKEKPANDDYKILRCFTNIPSVIVEGGFLTNPEEESKLATDEYQDKIADSIVKSIKEYAN